jgi:phospho-N-acetylmuramoyl-pentapeptide-transferase
MVHAMLAACLALVVTTLAGYPLLDELRRRKMGKAADTDVSDQMQAYADKAGTPTMGGVIILAGVLIAGISMAVTRDTDTLLPLAAMLAAAALGATDDVRTLVGATKIEAHAPWFWMVKWGVMLGMGLAVALVLYLHIDMDAAVVPHFGAYSLGVLYVPMAIIVFVVAISGAVITDGMDGLMAGTSAVAYAAYGAIALSQGQQGLGAFAFVVTGATAGFMWFNAYPAQVFMGDTGAQALATGLVVIAFMTGWWLLLPVIGVVFVAEGLSDVVQIGYFKASHGKRIFRMAPIHYHFQLIGWPETRVVARFWLVGLLGAFAGVALALAD